MRRYWLKESRIGQWNLHNKRGELRRVQDRTNNALESLNLQMGNRLPHHPSLLHFTTALEEETRLHVQRMNEIRGQKEIRQPFSRPYIPDFPSEYYRYIPPTPPQPIKSSTTNKQKRNEFAVGDYVLARWFVTQSFYGVEFDATIVGDNRNGTYSVDFDDGTKDPALDMQHIRLQPYKKRKKKA